MADRKQLAILRHGTIEWNTWRGKHPGVTSDLSGANLIGTQLNSADLSGANLTGANLSDANLSGADLSAAHLTKANLSRAHLIRADLTIAKLNEADLRGANLGATILRGADLSRADLTDTKLWHTVFSDTDLTSAELKSCRHLGPSTVDHRALTKSGPLPLAFLRGVGLPDLLIDLVPALRGNPLQFYACFISYSSQDSVFAERLFNDLQGSGVRCWFAPKNLKPGDFFRAEIDQAISAYDKLLLILSEHSIASAWVADEVEAALERERKTGQQVLFPIQIDDAVKNAGDWAAALRRRRHIGDMRAWKDPDAYRQAFADFLDALRTELAKPASETEG